MKRSLLFIAVVGSMLVWPLGLMAQEEEEDEDEASDAGLEEEGSVEEGSTIGSEGITEEEVAEAEEREEVDVPVEDTSGVETYWGVEELNEVEKGFFFNARFGYLTYFGDLGDYAGGGMMAGGGLGYDILEKLLSIEVDALTSFHSADIFDPITGQTDTDAMVNGDFAALRVPLAVNLKYFTTKRLELYGTLLGGLNYNDKAIDGFDANTGEEFSGSTIDYFAGGRAGVEYYAGLRHFSIGFDVEFDYIIQAKSMALSAAPMLKYTF